MSCWSRFSRVLLLQCFFFHGKDSLTKKAKERTYSLDLCWKFRSVFSKQLSLPLNKIDPFLLLNTRALSFFENSKTANEKCYTADIYLKLVKHIFSMEKQLLAKDKKIMQLRPHKNVFFCRYWGTSWAY